MRDREAVVEHRDVVGELVGFIEVLGREHRGGPVAHEHPQHVPEIAPAARVETRRGLVEEEHRGRDDEARGEVEAAAHASRERLHEAVGRVGQVERFEQVVGAWLRRLRRQVVEPADHHEVLPRAQEPVDGRLLRGDADARPHRVGVVHDVVAGDGRAPGGGRGQRR